VSARSHLFCGCREQYSERTTDPECIAGVGDFVTSAVEARPVEFEVAGRSCFVVPPACFAFECIRMHERVRIMARSRCVCFVSVSVKVVLFGNGRRLPRYEPTKGGLRVHQAIWRLGGVRPVSVRYVCCRPWPVIDRWRQSIQKRQDTDATICEAG